MSTLLIRNIAQLVTCDDSDRILQNVDLYCENGFIKTIGEALDVTADETIDGRYMLCYPGLVNTHHHLYQVFSRNLPQVQSMELFDWLRTLYEIWKNLDGDVVRLSSLTGMGELMKHGCTTCFDHHYVFPAHSGDLLESQFAAADALGIRMYASRGSMDLSKKDGGLPPDTVVQTVDEIMADSVRCIEKYHDDSYGAMHRVALAPCSPFSVSAELLRQTGSLIESPSGYLHLTARENLAIVADLKEVERRDIDRVLDIVHLTKDADRKVGQYSLGMKQRLGISMALLGSPKLLILDEPTNGLDPAGIQEMRSLIASMPQTTGATVLISSHLLGEIEQMVDQVGILNHGKVLLERSLSDLQDNTVKLQVAYQGVTEPPLPAELNILHRSHVGRVYTYIVRGSSQEILRRMQITEPVLLESIPLTLEEIFIYELGGADYAVREIIL